MGRGDIVMIGGATRMRGEWGVSVDEWGGIER